jgi:hypothetical protein
MRRISGYIQDELYEEIVDISKRENRKLAPTISILLQYAVREKNRKRQKKSYFTGNPYDMGKGNGQ